MSMEAAVPQSEHSFLEQLVGDWVLVSQSCDAEEGQGDLAETKWVETVRSLHGLWFVAEGEGTGPDGKPASTLMTLGYDPALGHYVGTWIGSMMTKLWVYKGTLEADGKTLTLEAEGPDFDSPGKTALYHDVITLLDHDRRLFTGSVRLPDGSWKQFMSAEYRRKI